MYTCEENTYVWRALTSGQDADAKDSPMLEPVNRAGVVNELDNSPNGGVKRTLLVTIWSFKYCQCQVLLLCTQGHEHCNCMALGTSCSSASVILAIVMT